MKKKRILLSALFFLIIGTISVKPFKDKVNAAQLYLDTHYYTAPSSLPGDYKYTTVATFEFNGTDVGYIDISDYTTQSITKSYGYVSDEFGTRYHIGLPGGGTSPLLRLQTKLENIAISDADGLLMYFDASEPDARSNVKTIGLGIGLVLMNSPTEPPVTTYLWNEGERGGHFSHYYLVDGRTAYYYDYMSSSFKNTVIMNKTVQVKEHFRGWLYMPFTSFGWNGRPETNYMMTEDAFVTNDYEYLNYSHVITRGFKEDDSQSKVYFDSLIFAKKGATCNHNFALLHTIPASCTQDGADVYRCACGQTYFTNITNKHHTYVYYKNSSNECVGICAKCDHVIEITDPEIIATATLVDELNVCNVNLHLGLNGEEVITRKVVKGKVLLAEDEPVVDYAIDTDGYKHNFVAWSDSNTKYNPVDPTKVNHQTDKDYYAKYLISSYDNTKYFHAINLLAMTDGTYNAPHGKIVFNGNSNFSLAYTAESDFAARGLPLINNAVAGGSTYNYYHYADQLVIGYAPKILCFNLTSNDQAYWSMSEKDIAALTDKYVKKVHEQLPDCVIAIVNSSPLPGRTEMYQTVERINEWAKKYASELDYVHYIDTYDFVYNRMLEYPDGWEMWTHMDTKTLSTWMNLICEGIIEIMEEHNIVF
ncbi:MAG: hypothetical protein BWX74_00465 [Tenericutes bacterium ADurb.Bin087]|nr:MAG: hypothetical protein BWX74_00465 [Tenericutes bacterium ADurb.Bin087]